MAITILLAPACDLLRSSDKHLHPVATWMTSVNPVESCVYGSGVTRWSGDLETQLPTATIHQV